MVPLPTLQPRLNQITSIRRRRRRLGRALKVLLRDAEFGAKGLVCVDLAEDVEDGLDCAVDAGEGGRFCGEEAAGEG